MAEFMVLDVNKERCPRVALLDRAGGYHVARAMAERPEVGACLVGNGMLAVDGVSLMVARASGQVYRLQVEVLNCGQMETLDRLHASATPEPRRAADCRTEPFVAERTTDTWISVTTHDRSDRG